ncbi:unnamed protein product [Heterobilharzia americana]|nr:unnamed protein product [Heterobilharzia americana]
MNLELLEAFHQNYPEAADGYLERIKKDDGSKDAGCATYAITLQFNRVGSLLAIGCNDGRIEIWDHVTRRISKVLVAHAHPVCSLSWSRDSKSFLAHQQTIQYLFGMCCLALASKPSSFPVLC